jgi:tetratricopeptide (TPR) repeat protein
MSIAISPGTYNVVLLNNGQELWHFDNVAIRLQPNNDAMVFDFDLKKEKGAAGAQAAGQSQSTSRVNAPKQKELTEEQKKEIERVNKENERITKENEKIKGLNQLLAQARTASQAGNYDQAVTVLNQATQADPNRDLLWGTLGDAYLGAAKKETDQTAKKEKYTQAASAYKKAIDLGTASADPKSKISLGSYYNNMGEALARGGQNDQAIAAYKAATAAEPTNATFQYNLGATLININKPDDAVAAFDQAITLKPDMANAYYYKGVALLSKATIKGDKMVPVPGTAEAFNKYLELQPDGPEAQGAKEMLSSIGAPVQTKFSNKKK